MPQVTFAHLESLMGDPAADPQLFGFTAAQAYLRKRGIDTPELIDALGLRLMPACSLYQATSNSPWQSKSEDIAIVFPHQSPDWWSARLVSTQPVKAVKSGWDALTIQKSRAKMHCPSGVAPVAYHPPILDWQNIPQGTTIYIHESAIKSINGAKLGFYSVGLNGVYGWSSERKHSVQLVEGLIDLPWRACSLKPVIVFDSNVNTNPAVGAARQRLAEKLHVIFNVDVAALDVPMTDTGEHQGFDDWCQGKSEQEIRDWLTQPPTPIEVTGLRAELAKMNDEVVLVRNIGTIVEVESGIQMTRDAFVNTIYANRIYLDADDNPRSVAKAWMVSDTRVEVERLAYNPGQPKLTPQAFNLWPGMGIEPAQGPVDHWLALLEHGVPDLQLRHWLIKWFAYPLQNLGCKLDTYLLFYGPQGVGKNALIAPFHTMYGKNATTVSTEHFDTSFNDTYSARQFINIDELSGGGGRDGLKIANKIKMLTTSPTLWVNTKGKAEYEVDNHVNLVITSNHGDSIKLEEGDRRATVIRFGTREHIQPAPYWDAYWAWLDNGGAAALYDYLLRVDLTGFDPHGRAPHTEWKEEVTDATRGPIEKFVRDLWDDAYSTLPLLLKSARVLTPDQLGHAYALISMPEDPTRVTSGQKNRLYQIMSEIGFKKTSIKIDKEMKRLWVIDRTIDPADNDTLRQAYKSITSTTQSKF
jgi:hypothetical protein